MWLNEIVDVVAKLWYNCLNYATMLYTEQTHFPKIKSQVSRFNIWPIFLPPERSSVTTWCKPRKQYTPKFFYEKMKQNTSVNVEMLPWMLVYAAILLPHQTPSFCFLSTYSLLSQKKVGGKFLNCLKHLFDCSCDCLCFIIT